MTKVKSNYMMFKVNLSGIKNKNMAAYILSKTNR